jgi:EamA domain-containing membrane protein RarD
MRKALEAIGSAVMKIVFSRKFLALVGVLLLGWEAFKVCLASESPVAWIVFAVLALFLALVLAAYVWANVKAKTPIVPPETPEV